MEITLDSQPRKKSPRAPTLGLQQALEGALKIYEKERRHAAPADVVAQHFGYKNASNGSALQALASLKYYGLLERGQPGKMAVSKDVEAYNYAPSQEVRDEILLRSLKSPPIFAELIERYGSQLPSDATMKFDLIKRGFLPEAADSVVAVFRDSLAFARYLERVSSAQPIDSEDPAGEGKQVHVGAADLSDAARPADSERAHSQRPVPGSDRIPVRLTGGRRAFLEIPTPFHQADKERLKSQIDLLLTVEDEQVGQEAD